MNLICYSLVIIVAAVGCVSASVKTQKNGVDVMNVETLFKTIIDGSHPARQEAEKRLYRSLASERLTKQDLEIKNSFFAFLAKINSPRSTSKKFAELYFETVETLIEDLKNGSNKEEINFLLQRLTTLGLNRYESWRKYWPIRKSWYSEHFLGKALELRRK